ncbi:MAG: hypothetical protein LBN09_01720 [Clostridioides sp.]|jgi:hypothetical protein|nr:hypothetical protein [Clostridioides sp.]
MRTFRIKGDTNLYFKNSQRIPEDILFENIKNELSEDARILIGQKTIGPSEDIYKCKIDGIDFELVYDIDDGGCISSKSEAAIELLEKILNK